MRVTTVQRAALGARHQRLDPAFYVRRQSIRAVVDWDGAQHVRLADLVMAIQDGARLPAAPAGVPILCLSNLQPCEVDLHGLRYVDGTRAIGQNCGRATWSSHVLRNLSAPPWSQRRCQHR